MAESTGEVIVKSIFMTVFIVLGICGNALVCFAIKTNSRLRTMTNYYVFNLAVADFLFCITGMPLILITTIARRWVLGAAMCQISGTLNTLFVLVSIWTLTLISVNRYFAVGRATSYKSVYRKNRVIASIACVWILAALMAIAPQIGWSEIIEGDNFCTINGREDISYSGMVITFAYIAPLIILICLYLKIFYVLREHEKSMAAMRGGSMVTRGYSEADFDTGSADYSESKGLSLERGGKKQENTLSAVNNEKNTADCKAGGLNSSSTADFTQDGGKVDSDSNENVKNASGSPQGFGAENAGQEILEDGNIENTEQEIAEQEEMEDVDQEIVEQDLVNVEFVNTTDDSIEDMGESPGNDKKLKASASTGSESQVKLIIDGNGRSPAVVYDREEQTDKIPRRSKLNTLTNLSKTVKLKRSRTSKKIKKFMMEARITKMLFVVVAFFFICWTPLVLGTILYAFNAEPKNFNMLSMGFVVACMNSICNPIIYAFMNKLFRKAFRETFQKLRTKCCCWKEPRNES